MNDQTNFPGDQEMPVREYWHEDFRASLKLSGCLTIEEDRCNSSSFPLAHLSRFEWSPIGPQEPSESGAKTRNKYWVLEFEFPTKTVRIHTPFPKQLLATILSGATAVLIRRFNGTSGAGDDYQWSNPQDTASKSQCYETGNIQII
jgi:hypothetical protein